jgi:hypothetical protein
MSQEQVLIRGFRYKYGDRPLDGYTIQRGAGRGGFGEVYYAVSDSGREVALKVVQGYEQIELRGVSHCMNLKSPHLVTVFDVRHNDEGVPFIIMEFVAGPSLRQLLDESPSGLGAQKTAFFLREIGKGLSYLHECGIVHRDLKPGNIFYENGYVKIGDYGLSKAMSATQHSGQTITVGTVHYMAPEISMGRYDKSIDIYALGVMLYEMLTGTPPYLGSSPGEILMKHLSAEPCVAGIEEPFATVIKKAMARDPKDRYQNVQEMVEAVFGAEHVRQSVSCFSPDSLSMVAQRVAQRVAGGAGSATPPPLPKKDGVGGDFGDRMEQWGERFGQRMEAVGERMGQWGERLGQRMGQIGNRNAAAPVAGPTDLAAGDPSRDPLALRNRRLLVVGTLVVVAMATTFFSSSTSRQGPGPEMLLAFLATSGLASGMRLAHRRIIPQLASETEGMRRLVVSGMGAAGLLALCFPVLVAFHETTGFAGGTLVGILAPLLIFNWIPRMAADRAERIEFGQALVAGAVAFFVGLFFNGVGSLALGIVAGASLLVQVMSPWDPVAGRWTREAGEAQSSDDSAAAAGAGVVDGRRPATADTPTAAVRGAAVPPPLPLARGPRAPQGVRLLWLLGMAFSFSLGLMQLIYAGTNTHIHEQTFACCVAGGVGFLLAALICLRRGVQTTFTGWWSYLIKPLAMWGCAQAVLLAALMLGNMRLSDERQIAMIFLIILFSILLLIIAFVRLSPPPRPLAAQPAVVSSSSLNVGAVLTQGRDFVLGMIGSLLLLGSIIMGLLAAVDVPEMIAAGLPNPRVREQVVLRVGEEHLISTPNMALTGLTYVGLFVAVVFIMFARRWSGAAHVVRALAAVPIAALGLWTLDQALPGPWRMMEGKAAMPAAVEAYFNAALRGQVLIAGLLILAGFAIVIWPASRRSTAGTSIQERAK